jgi:HAD superfamily hydrolase (TIGR01549 family)
LKTDPILDFLLVKAYKKYYSPHELMDWKKTMQAIVFDFGGTLDSDGGHWLNRFYDLYEKCRSDIPRSAIKRVFYEADAICCATPQINHMKLRPLMAYHVHLQFQGLNLRDKALQNQLVEDFCRPMEDCLKRNASIIFRIRQKGYKMGVISNFYGNVATILNEAGFGDSLDVILDSVQVGFAKPDHRIFEMGLKQLGLLPHQVCFVGDSLERDMVPAKDMGMKTVWLTGPNTYIPATVKNLDQYVDAAITRLSQLERLIA